MHFDVSLGNGSDVVDYVGVAVLGHVDNFRIEVLVEEFLLEVFGSVGAQVLAGAYDVHLRHYVGDGVYLRFGEVVVEVAAGVAVLVAQLVQVSGHRLIVGGENGVVPVGTQQVGYRGRHAATAGSEAAVIQKLIENAEFGLVGQVTLAGIAGESVVTVTGYIVVLARKEQARTDCAERRRVQRFRQKGESLHLFSVFIAAIASFRSIFPPAKIRFFFFPQAKNCFLWNFFRISAGIRTNRASAGRQNATILRLLPAGRGGRHVGAEEE